MDAIFDALGERNRRAILTTLTAGELSAGAIVDAMQANGAISQPAVSQHLKLLREAGLISVRADGARRVYAIDPDGIDAAIAWLTSVHDPAGSLAHPLDPLATEVARGKRARSAKAKATRKRSRRSA